ncbi:MAG: porin [Planctomycetes bacterium]|nr:porin [Planctomycetota bacterium]
MANPRQWNRLCRYSPLALALGASIFVPSLSHADEPAAAPAPDAPVTHDLAMEGLDKIGLGDAFKANNMKLYGWAEAGYTYNHASPTDRVNRLRTFDTRSNDILLNQLTLNLEKTLKEGKDFDFSGKIELLYGSDGRVIHSANLGDNINGDADELIDGTQVEFDPVQFYGLVRLPVGNGLTVKFGKYVTTLGSEVIDAPGNLFYSHSFLFGYAIPFTHTGVQLDYAINDKIGVYYGVTFGYDQFGDINDTLTQMAGMSYKLNEKTTILFNAITGPEREDENTDYRTVFDTVVNYTITDSIIFSVNGDFGNESGTNVEGAAGNNWMGVASYLTFKIIPDTLNVNLRAEYMRDETASRLGITGDMMELTAGLDIHPCKKFQNLRVRPEVRYDRAFGDSPFDTGMIPGGSDREQFTAGLDVIVTF